VPLLQPENCLPCRHSLNAEAVQRLRQLLETLPQHSAQLLENHQISIGDYKLLFSAAIQAIRGTAAATTADKRRFVDAILAIMTNRGHVDEWAFIGSQGMQDYRVKLTGGRLVCIEVKGCPDGNNMTIWERPSWAEEFIIWSQCPESLAHHPGEGVWSGIATRLFGAVYSRKVTVDALVFYDGRCGSDQRHCPKSYGIEGAARNRATDIPGHEGRRWLPPPSVFLFPRTVPHPVTNPSPPLHTLETCQFVARLLGAFGVPEGDRPSYTNWAQFQVRPDPAGGVWRRVLVGNNSVEPNVWVEGGWTRLRRE
jgi:hypothetical protein